MALSERASLWRPGGEGEGDASEDDEDGGEGGGEPGAVAAIVEEGRKRERRAVRKRERERVAEEKLVQVRELARAATVLVTLDMSLNSAAKVSNKRNITARHHREHPGPNR